MAALTAVARGRYAASIVGILVGLASFAVYYATLAPDLAWDYYGADGGELITAAVTLGVPHPPGYPTYVLLGKLVSLLPLGNVAYRFNLFSALCMSGAVAMTAAAAFHRLKRLLAGQLPQSALIIGVPFWAATAAGLTLAFFPVLWQQALIAEVYALNLLLHSALLLHLSRHGRRHNGWLAGILLGLATTTHLTSILMLPLVLWCTARTRWSRFLLGLVIGSAPYQLLPLFALGHSPVVWGDLSTLEGWWWLVSARLYAPNTVALRNIDWLTRLRQWAAEPGVWFLLAALLLARRGWRRQAPEVRRGTLIAIFTTLLFAGYALTYDADNALVYLLPALLLSTILLVRIFYRLGPLAMLLPLALLMLNFSRIDLSEQYQARTLTMSLLREAPREALLLTDGDRATFTFWYLQHVEGKRSDLIIVDQNLLAFDWYRQRLQRQYPELQQLQEDDLKQFRQANQKVRSLCSVHIPADAPEQTEFNCTEG